jgi:hypothetical protein
VCVHVLWSEASSVHMVESAMGVFRLLSVMLRMEHMASSILGKYLPLCYQSLLPTLSCFLALSLSFLQYWGLNTEHSP